MTVEIKHLQDLFELRFAGLDDRFAVLQRSMTSIDASLHKQTQAITDIELLKLKSDTQAAQILVLQGNHAGHLADIIQLKSEIASSAPIRGGAVKMASLTFGAVIVLILAKIFGGLQ